MSSSIPEFDWTNGSPQKKNRLLSVIARVFDIRERANQIIILSLIVIAVLLVVGAFYGLGYVFKGATIFYAAPSAKTGTTEGIATESLAIWVFVLGLIVNFAILVWSIATLQSQKEQGERIRKLLISSQSLGPDVAEQMRLLEEDFRRHLSGREYDFELTVYVSSPGFGIVGGSEGVGYFCKILTEFIKLAMERAQHPTQKMHSSLELFFWKKEDHVAALGSKKTPNGLWLWSGDHKEQRELVLAQLKGLAAKFEDLKKLNSKYIKVTQRVAKKDELRFVFLKQGERNLWAGMMAFAPLEKVIHIPNHLHNVLLMDHSDTDAHHIYDFFETFIKAYEHDPAPNEDLLLNEPRTVLANFFELSADSLA